ncbi:hypothetical protein LTR85_001206 [Meristemomyces frigidus]|nr:hypothetical protein LTR85_001206 [Meristemomyces frigidus]
MGSTDRRSPVWQAIDHADETSQFVIKAPSTQDDSTKDWPLFRHEHNVQKLFAESPLIRPMLDFVPETEQYPPAMVLRAFEETLWTARTRRAFTSKEIKWIMKAVILAVWTIHRKGLVYSDLKTENVLISGFRDEHPGPIREIIVRLADCGATIPPSDRRITSITYRSPEVYYRKPWTSSTDIWSWGIVLFHLLEAQADIEAPGLYYSICTGSLEDKAAAVRAGIEYDFDLAFNPYFAADGRSESCVTKVAEAQAHSRDEEREVWYDRLIKKGVAAEDVQFLLDILNPDPRKRWTAADIVRCGYLEID